MKQQPASKDDYISDQVYALLGTHGYPFLSLKKLVVNCFKRVDNLASKLISQHYDLIGMNFYKSSKCTLTNSLTSSLLMFNMWQNMQFAAVQDVLPIQFGQTLFGMMRDLRENVFMVENYAGFMNLQLIYFENDRKK